METRLSKGFASPLRVGPVLVAAALALAFAPSALADGVIVPVAPAVVEATVDAGVAAVSAAAPTAAPAVAAQATVAPAKPVRARVEVAASKPAKPLPAAARPVADAPAQVAATVAFEPAVVAASSASIEVPLVTAAEPDARVAAPFSPTRTSKQAAPATNRARKSVARSFKPVSLVMSSPSAARTALETAPTPRRDVDPLRRAADGLASTISRAPEKVGSGAAAAIRPFPPAPSLFLDGPSGFTSSGTGSAAAAALVLLALLVAVASLVPPVLPARYRAGRAGPRLLLFPLLLERPG